MVARKKWRWFGYAGHFIGSPRCRFHLHTRIGNFRISTVGSYYPTDNRDEPTEVGLGRLYETYVFRISGECRQCTPPCGAGEISDWCEIDSLPANDSTTAEENHMKLCKKYARGEA